MQVTGTETLTGQLSRLQKWSIQMPMRPDNQCKGAEQAGGEQGGPLGTCWPTTVF